MLIITISTRVRVAIQVCFPSLLYLVLRITCDLIIYKSLSRGLDN